MRQKGSYLIIRCGNRTATPVHSGEDLKPGTLRAIERQFEPCLGKGWWWRANHRGSSAANQGGIGPGTR